MTVVNEVYGYKQTSASGNVCAGACSFAGVFCSSSTSGTLTIYDDASTGTVTKAVDTFSLIPGQYYAIPMGLTNGCNLVVGGTASITAFFTRT